MRNKSLHSTQHLRGWNAASHIVAPSIFAGDMQMRTVGILPFVLHWRAGKPLSTLSETWQIVKAAGAVNSELVPCDVPSFTSFLRESLTVAFVKEPRATELFMEAVVDLRSKLAEARRAQSRNSLIVFRRWTEAP